MGIAAYHRVSILLLLVALPTVAVAEELAGYPKIIDGDTVEIEGHRVRLHGIDTPEAKQTCTRNDGSDYACGKEATAALITIVGEHLVTCTGDIRDRYGRWIMVCFLDTIDINAELVRQGWALAYRKYSTDYINEEADARNARRGLWQGAFMPPWEWRKQK